MKKSHTLLAFLALALAVCVSLPGVWAYFTANVRAGGGRTLRLQGDTQMEETFANWNKGITITAQPGTQPVYVRARAYSSYKLVYEGTDWAPNVPDDGWYYYATPLASPPSDGSETVPAWTQEKTAVLTVRIPDPVKVENPGEVPEDFDVTVVYESTPVLYREDGTRYADWSRSTLLQNGGAGE